MPSGWATRKMYWFPASALGYSDNIETGTPSQTVRSAACGFLGAADEALNKETSFHCDMRGLQ